MTIEEFTRRANLLQTMLQWSNAACLQAGLARIGQGSPEMARVAARTAVTCLQLSRRGLER